MTDETYNGWTNRATWLLSLWFNNDRRLYQMKEDCIDGILEEAGTYEEACEMLNGFFVDYMQDSVDRAAMVSPIINDYLDIMSQINFDEVVESEMDVYRNRFSASEPGVNA